MRQIKQARWRARRCLPEAAAGGATLACAGPASGRAHAPGLAAALMTLVKRFEVDRGHPAAAGPKRCSPADRPTAAWCMQPAHRAFRAAG